MEEAEPMYFVLLYDLAPDYLESRGQYRTEHLQLAEQAHQRGELLMAGPLTDPFDTGLLIFKADGPETVEAFAKADPYVQNGVVNGYRVRTWNNVIGG
jgi:uncharacterized protein